MNKIVIKNLSNIYIEKMVTTVHQFLEFVNIYKLDNKYDSIEKFSLNDVRILTMLALGSKPRA